MAVKHGLGAWLLPSGNQTWQWKIPYKCRFSWGNTPISTVHFPEGTYAYCIDPADIVRLGRPLASTPRQPVDLKHRAGLLP